VDNSALQGAPRRGKPERRRTGGATKWGSMIERSFEDGMYIRLVQGTQRGRTITYVHGLGESGLCFEKLISDPRLAAWTHLVPDLPGYGKSDWPPRPMPLHEQAAMLASIIAARHMAPAVVLGHSMGGVIGTMLCEQHPELVRGFINLEGNISLADCAFSGKAAAYRADEFAAAGHAAMLDEIYRAGVSDLPQRTYFASIQMCDARSFHLNSAELVMLSGSEKLAGRLGALEPPCVYIAGSPRGTGTRSCELLTEAGVPLQAVQNAGHWPFIDQQQDFVGRILEFLSNLPVPVR
jgi:pimeloyl-ACP methyl ester carboxylesterase